MGSLFRLLCLSLYPVLLLADACPVGGVISPKVTKQQQQKHKKTTTQVWKGSRSISDKQKTRARTKETACMVGG